MHKRNPTRDRIPKRSRQPRARPQPVTDTGHLPVQEQAPPGQLPGFVPTQVLPPTLPKNRSVSVIKRKKASETVQVQNEKSERIRNKVVMPGPPMEGLRGPGIPIPPMHNFGDTHGLHPPIGINPSIGNPLVNQPFNFLMSQNLGDGANLGNHPMLPFDGIPKPFPGPMPNPFFPFPGLHMPQIFPYANMVQDLMGNKGPPRYPSKHVEANTKQRLLVSKHIKVEKNSLLGLSELNRIKSRIKRISHVLDITTRALEKVRFSLPSIFRMRYKYTLKPFEDTFLSNIESVYRFILFVHLIKGFKESVPFDLSKDSDFDPGEEPVLGKNTLISFCNDSTDCSLVDVSANNGCNFNNGWVILKWNTAPSITYLKYFLDYASPSKNRQKHLVFVRGINVNVIVDNIEFIKEMCLSDDRIEEQFMQMLGYYCILCNEESYITFISSIIPALSRDQSVCFYENLSRLLDKTECNLQTRYLECFIERILPICLSQDSEHWRCIIRGIVNILNPLKLGTRKKYTTCAVTLLRSLKSYCGTFVKCKLTTCTVFHACLRYILQSGDDSCILIRGEATDLAIQIWLNEDGKSHVLESLGYDSVRILGSISGIQSVKLNIWSDILKNHTTFDSIPKCSGLFCMRDENLLFLLLSKSEDIFAILQFLDYKEASRICTILNASKLNYHALFWFMNKYLRATKTSLALEKISIIIRLSFLCFPALMKLNYEGSKGADSSYSISKFLNGTTTLGPFVHWALTTAANTGNVGACLEIANIKMSIFIDWLFYCYKFNSIFLKHISRSGLLKVTMSTSSTAHFLPNCYLNSIPIIQNLVRSLNIPLVATTLEEQNYSGAEDTNISKPTDMLGIILENYRPCNENCDSSRTKDTGFCAVKKSETEEYRKLWDLLQAGGPLTILAASEILVFSFNSNVEFGRLLVDYLLHSVWNYCSDKVAVLSLGVISSIVTCSLLVLIFNKSRITTLQSLIKELKRTILGKLCLIYNIGLEYLHIKVTSVPFESVGDFKNIYSTNFEVLTPLQEFDETSYTKVCSITDKKDQFCYENFLKYIIFQSFSLMLEFYLNYDYFMIHESNSGTIDGKTLASSIMTNSSGKKWHKVLGAILGLSHVSSVESLSSYLGASLDNYAFPNYILQCNNKDACSHDHTNNTEDVLKGGNDLLIMICSMRCSFRSPQRPLEDLDFETCSQYEIGFIVDVIATTLAFCTLEKCAHNYCSTRRDPLFSLAYLDSEFLINTLSNMFARVSTENDKLCWELLYYIASLSAAVDGHRYGCKGSVPPVIENFNSNPGKNICKGKFLLKKLHVMTKVFLNCLSSVSEVKNQSMNDSLNDLLERCIERCIDSENSNGSAQLSKFNSTVEKLMPIRLVLEIIVHSNVLWSYFRGFPSIVTTLLRVSPISTLTSFLSSFSFLHISKCNYLLGPSNNSHFNIFASYSSKYLTVGSSDRETEESIRYILLKDADVAAMHFRRYFISWQLLIRMYELQNCTRRMHTVLWDDRNFLKHFTTGTISFDQIDATEYFSRDSLPGASTDGISDDGCICYIGSSNTRSNFMIFSKGYTFSTPNDMFCNTNLHILSRILLEIVTMKNIRLIQVAMFSLFPVFISSAPTELVLHHILFSLNFLGSDCNSSAASSFIKYILLTVILNWFYRYSIAFYYFTSTSFIDGKHKLSLDTDFVSRYVDRYCDGYAIEFSFNYTTARIPLEFVQTLLHIFN